jgi:cephalosporin hydroxylase
MTSLKELVKNIDLNQELLIPKGKWIHQWGVGIENSKVLYNLILKTKPEVIIETGTFEGQGTTVIAQAAHENNNNCRIYTIDYDGDPTSDKINEQEWNELKEIRDNNLNNLKQNYPNCKVVFLNGDSRQKLLEIFNQYGETKCDLFYQDSMHFFEGIQQEWKLVEPYLFQNSITIFDDLALKGVRLFKFWFEKTYKNKYEFYQFLQGHKQFIVKKL